MTENELNRFKVEALSAFVARRDVFCLCDGDWKVFKIIAIHENPKEYCEKYHASAVEIEGLTPDGKKLAFLSRPDNTIRQLPLESIKFNLSIFDVFPEFEKDKEQ